MKYSIGICTYNRIDTLLLCIEAIHEHLRGRSDYEVIVINNNSTDDTVNALNTIDDIKVYNEYNQGLSYARNRFINESDGEYLLFLDDDAIISCDILQGYDEAIQNYPECGIFGGKVLPELGIKTPNWFDHNFYMLYSILDIGDEIKEFNKPYGPIGANFLVKKNIIDTHRFRTDLGRIGNNLLSGEETDFILKLRHNSNSIVYVPSAMVYHHFEHKRYDFSWALERFKQNGRSDYLLRSESKSTVKGLISQIYHFIKSFKSGNSKFIQANLYSLHYYIKTMLNL